MRSTILGIVTRVAALLVLLGDVMTQAYGEEKAGEIFDHFADTFRSAENMVVVARPDLSVNPPYGGTGNDR